MAVAISIVVTGAVPAALGIHAYVDIVAHGQVAARVSAERIGQYAFVQGDIWRFSSHRIAELIGSSADALNSPRQYVEFADGSPIVDIGEPLHGPTVSGVWPIIVLGERVGAVRVEGSLIPLFWKVGFLTLLGGLLGGFTYMVIDSMPLRALQRVTDDLQKTQSELAATHVRLAEAIEALPDGFALFDDQDRLTLCNRRFLDIYRLAPTDVADGATFEDILRKGVRDGHYPDARGREEAWIAERGQQHRHFDGTIEQELGDGRFLRIVERSMGDGSRVGIRTDITDLKKSEAERIAFQQQFHQAQQLQALGTLAGGVAHDFNNILAIVIGNAELLAVELPAEAPSQYAIAEIITASERGAQLVRQILTYTRREQTEVSAVSLDDVLKEEFSLLRASLPTTIDIRLRPLPGATVIGNRTQLHQILMNLCVNASLAIGNRPGAIDIEMDAIDVRPEDPVTAHLQRGSTGAVEAIGGDDRLTYRVGTLMPGAYWRLTVRDDGSGMEAEVLRRIFEPFFTTREVGSGTGLGLSAVSGIVIGMDGAILVRTAPARGTLFEIYMPKGYASSTTHALAPPLAMGERPSWHVMFIDDEPALVTLGEQQFRNAGYTVLGLSNPQTALHHFRAQPDAWDLIVTDQTMPGMTGIDLAKKMLELRPTMPIILCTGYTEPLNDDSITRMGIRALLMKPTRREELLDTAERVMA